MFHFLRACITEGGRMNPIVSGNVRVMPEDFDLMGFRVKAGTTIMFPSDIMNRDPK